MLPYDQFGAGPDVVLLHAGVGDRRMWTEALPWLAEAGFRALALDLPGFGEAPVAPAGQAPWTDVLDTMDALGLERVALVGNSFGGAVALRAALVAPERVTALALISAPAPGIEPSAELQEAWSAEEAAIERGDLDAAVRAVLDAWMLPDGPPAVRERVAAMQRQALTVQMQTPPAEDEGPDPVEDHPEALEDLAIPTLVLAGERDRPDFRTGAEALARTLPRARHAVIPGAGHLAPLETPEAVRDVLLEFLGDTVSRD